MNNIGFPNTDIYSEHEQGGAESFWPSFTDIMMVIVMVFLMITVAVILNNWELINNLKSSVEAERLAMAKAQSAMHVVEVKAKENETLGERLSRLESLLSTRTQNLQLAHQQQQQTSLSLQKSQQAVKAAQATIQALTQEKEQQVKLLVGVQQSLDQQKQQVSALEQDKETLQQDREVLQQEKDASVATTTSLQKTLAEQQQQLAILQEEKEQNKNDSQQVQVTLATVNKALENKSKELELLRQKDVEGHEQLVSLKGDYDQLDKKYQKLLRPARSVKNKHVVRVVYNKVNGRNSYQLGDEEQKLVTLSRSKLDETLTRLKEKYGDDLYVKIIIPASSNVSHADAWRFTSDMLTQYDYYHADDAATPKTSE